MPGNGSFDPVGEIPMRELPWKVVPAEAAGGGGKEVDFITAGNNKMYPLAYRYALGYDYFPYFRATRMAEMLAGRGCDSVSRAAEIQLDNQSNLWTTLFRPWLQTQPGLRLRHPFLQEMYTRWEGAVVPGCRYPAVLWEYLSIVTQIAFEGRKRRDHAPVDPILGYYWSVDHAGSVALERAWEQAIYAPVGGWTEDWGYVQLPHLTLALTPFRCFGNRYPRKLGGDESSLNMMRGRRPGASHVRRIGPALRQILRVGEEVHVASVGGGSENPFSPFYDNTLQQWSVGEYRKKTFAEVGNLTRTDGAPVQYLRVR